MGEKFGPYHKQTNNISIKVCPQSYEANEKENDIIQLYWGLSVINSLVSPPSLGEYTPILQSSL